MSPLQEHNEPAVLLHKPHHNLVCFTETCLSLAQNSGHLVSQKLWGTWSEERCSSDFSDIISKTNMYFKPSHPPSKWPLISLHFWKPYGNTWTLLMKTCSIHSKLGKSLLVQGIPVTKILGFVVFFKARCLPFHIQKSTLLLNKIKKNHKQVDISLWRNRNSIKTIKDWMYLL